MLQVEIVVASALAGRVAVARTQDKRLLKAIARVCLRELRDVAAADPALRPIVEGQITSLLMALREEGIELSVPVEWPMITGLAGQAEQSDWKEGTRD